jgi:hypothetical protein
MERRKCDHCDQPAVYHETVVEAGEAIEHHLCAAHGEPTWRAVASRLPPAEKEPFLKLAERMLRERGLEDEAIRTALETLRQRLDQLP